eukprot:2857893-Pyramimonas_sp.AAC.1
MPRESLVRVGWRARRLSRELSARSQVAPIAVVRTLALTSVSCQDSAVRAKVLASATGTPPHLHQRFVRLMVRVTAATE